MEYQIVWGGDPEDVLITTSGDATVEDLRAMTHEALSDLRFRADMKILLDHTQTRWWTLSNEDIDRCAELAAGDSARLGRQRMALAVGSPVDDGIASMLRSRIAGRLQFEPEIFDSLSAARDWLRNG